MYLALNLFIKRQIDEISSEGWPTIRRKLRRLALLSFELPLVFLAFSLVLLFRLISPFVIVRIGAVDIGRMIGAKYMVVGSISKVGGSYNLDSRMISVETGESYISAQFTSNGKIDKVLKLGIPSLAYQLCEIEPPKISPLKKMTGYIYKNRFIIGVVSFLVWMGWGWMPPVI